MAPLNEENLLSRWSRRKQQSTQATQQEDPLINLQQQNVSEPEIENILKTDDEAELQQPEVVLTDEDMPAISSLNEESDFSAFMSSGVSDELRNLALRKLFAAPVFNFRDGLDEYDEDYTSFEKLGDIVTCDMKHQIEMEAKKKLQEEAERLSEQNLDDETGQASIDQALIEQTEPDIDKNQQHDMQSLDSALTQQQLDGELTTDNTALNNE